MRRRSLLNRTAKGGWPPWTIGPSLFGGIFGPHLPADLCRPFPNVLPGNSVPRARPGITNSAGEDIKFQPAGGV